MKKVFYQSFNILCFAVFIFSKTNAQGVGINATGAVPDASAMLHVDGGTKGFLVTGTIGGAVPDLGAGSRLMFYPANAAFCAGNITGTQWNNINVRLYSVALGNNPIASGNNSTALGINSIACGPGSTAMGYFTTANGTNSTAMGRFVSTNSKNGAFIIGDVFGTGTSSSAGNEMTIGFSGGFRLYSSSNAITGVLMPANGNAWLSVSDVNRKENFEPIDDEAVLQKMSKIEFTSLNYKQQEPKVYRHYGIMAQDFYKAFGHDQFGRIGNDTTVNPTDMPGIDMTAIQALEKRTVSLKNENESLRASVDESQKKVYRTAKIIRTNT